MTDHNKEVNGIDWSRKDLVQQVPVSMLRSDPSNPRKHASQEGMRELISNIKKNGIRKPLFIRPGEDSTFVYILAGHRRTYAAKEAGLTTVPCIVRPSGMSKLEILEELIGDNLHQEEMPPVDQAVLFRQYMEESGCSANELAAILDLSPMTISQYMQILNLPEEVKELVNRGEISKTAGYWINRCNAPAKEKIRLAREAASGMLTTRKLEIIAKGDSQKSSPKHFNTTGVIFERKFSLNEGRVRIVITCNNQRLTEEQIRQYLQQAIGKLTISMEAV